MSDNPLLKYHIQPGTFVKLPSEGRFYEHPPQITADGEIEVKPMNAADELQFQNPDSLLNNEALFQVIGRCVPGISHPREILKPDMDVLLLGLRVATYGDTMEIGATCSSCDKKEVYVSNLSTMLAQSRAISGSTTVKMSELVIHIRPFTVSSQQQLGETMVAIKRLAKDLQRRVNDGDTDEQMMEVMKNQMAGHVKSSSDEIFKVAANSIERIETPDGVVTDPEHIRDWLNSVRAPDYKVIRDAVRELSEETVDRTMKFKCKHCEAENEVEVQFDPANFFGLNSAKQ